MKRFKHSGTLGDIVYGLALMKHLGGGEFYLHLNQVDWIGQHYYGSPPAAYHQGRMNEKDFEFMKDFMLAQDYITGFDTMTATTEITHNLDRFRPLFVNHPANYTTTYCMAFNIMDPVIHESIVELPWISVPNPIKVEGKPYVVNRSARGFTAPGCNPQWTDWKEQGLDQQSIFVGLPDEYEAFKQLTGWNLDFHPTKTMLELASVIAGAEHFLGNQSVALSIAQALRVPYGFEARRDLPLERNESYFPNHENGTCF